MTTTVEDSLEREILVQAPIEKVYAALTQPEKLAGWFPDAVEGSLAPGERPVLDFGKYGKISLYIEAANPHDYFAFRWVSGSHLIPDGFLGDVLQHPNTLVEFRLTQEDGGTRVHVRESGFASLPQHYAAGNLKDNQEGWEFMLDRLRSYID